MTDKRKHIFISDRNLQEKIDQVKHVEDLTYDEIFAKYLNLPDGDLAIYEKYLETQKLLERAYHNSKLKSLSELLWVLLIKSAKGEYDIDRLLHDVSADIEVRTYKKR